MPLGAAAWQCWLNGGSACSPGISYTVAGMQTLVNTVRAAGANNVIMLGGLYVRERPDPVAQVRAQGPRPQPGRLVALLQLQQLQ